MKFDLLRSAFSNLGSEIEGVGDGEIELDVRDVNGEFQLMNLAHISSVHSYSISDIRQGWIK